MVEYALMICLCALIAIGAIGILGKRLGPHFDTAASALGHGGTGRHPKGCDVSNGRASEHNPNC